MKTVKDLRALAEARVKRDLEQAPLYSQGAALHLIDAILSALTAEQREQVARWLRTIDAEFPEAADEDEPSLYDSTPELFVSRDCAKATVTDAEIGDALTQGQRDAERVRNYKDRHDPDPAEARCGCNESEHLRDEIMLLRAAIKNALHQYRHGDPAHSMELLEAAIR